MSVRRKGVSSTTMNMRNLIVMMTFTKMRMNFPATTMRRIRMKLTTDEDVRIVERFVVKVQAMREAQRNWLRFRGSVMKAHALQMEKEVDQQLEAWEMERVMEEARREHPELFPAK
jgi:hypothetical protein